MKQAMVLTMPLAARAPVSLDFETLVSQYYRPLYQFAFVLTRSEADACDLTQQTFYVWAAKGRQLRDPSKVKSWLFTALHRAFLEIRRKQARAPHYELREMDSELPPVAPPEVNQLDSSHVIAALACVDEVYRAPVSLFYLDDYSYKEIAQSLGVPLGTVKSRIARGIAQLQRLLGDASPGTPAATPQTPAQDHNGFTSLLESRQALAV
jgi:RNA polymerase sigma-70 factor (ECF subfamily)